MRRIVSKTVQRNVFNWQIVFSTNPFDNGAYGVCGLNCALYVRQNCAKSLLICSFPLSVTRMFGILIFGNPMVK